MRLRLILISVLAVSLAACGGQSTHSGKTRVVAAFYPLAYAAGQIGGTSVSVTNLTPAGAEPHDLELSPKAVREIHDADVVLVLGNGFQPQVEAAARQSSGKVIALLDTSGLHRHANGDPHVWLDPKRYALIVREIGRVLRKESAAAALVARLSALDAEYRQGLADCERHQIVTSHAAFAYLSEHYGLRQVSIEGVSPEAEPTPQQLQRVASVVRRNRVTTVYFETLVSPKVAKTLARETGTKSAVLDPIEGLLPTAIKHGESYFTVMRRNLATLREGLGCR
jgi:zinc transport system substrate-binding protein